MDAPSASRHRVQTGQAEPGGCQSVEQQAAFGQRLVNQREFTLFQVAKATVSETTLTGLRVHREVVLLNQRDGESTLSRIMGTSATNNATADDKNIEWTCRICSHFGPKALREKHRRAMSEPGATMFKSLRVEYNLYALELQAAVAARSPRPTSQPADEVPPCRRSCGWTQ